MTAHEIAQAYALGLQLAPITNTTLHGYASRRLGREKRVERQEGKEGMKHKGKKEGTHLPTYPELDTDGDVPGVLGDVLTGGVLGDDALAFYTRVPSPLDADGDVDVDAARERDAGGDVDVDGTGTRDDGHAPAAPFRCVDRCVACIVDGSGKFCMPDVDAGERLDFAGTRRPEIVRFRGVVGGDAEAEALVVLLLLPLALALGLDWQYVERRRWAGADASAAAVRGRASLLFAPLLRVACPVQVY
ncbi:hypothetical protein B0H13DRAFT_2557095 [Mycena leptocephala]|nr:hypothetical protein B0H13DRAFT_2557095 [Mycena leptocephala]